MIKAILHWFTAKPSVEIRTFTCAVCHKERRTAEPAIVHPPVFADQDDDDVSVCDDCWPGVERRLKALKD